MILLSENTISLTQKCDSGPSFSYFTNSNFYFLFCLHCPFCAEKCALVWCLRLSSIISGVTVVTFFSLPKEISQGPMVWFLSVLFCFILSGAPNRNAQECQDNWSDSFCFAPELVPCCFSVVSQDFSSTHLSQSRSPYSWFCCSNHCWNLIRLPHQVG